MDKPRPVCVALLICDGIVNDPLTRKVSFVGVFTRLTLAKLPAVVPQIALNATLTNVKGRHEIGFTLRHEKSGAIVIPMPREKEIFAFDDPNGLLDVGTTARNVTFTEAGPHRLEVIVDGETIGSRPLFVFVLKDDAGTIARPGR